MLLRRDRRSANSNFLNSRARPNTLATAAAVPSFTRSWKNSDCQSTELFFHEFGEFEEISKGPFPKDPPQRHGDTERFNLRTAAFIKGGHSADLEKVRHQKS